MKRNAAVQRQKRKRWPRADDVCGLSRYGQLRYLPLRIAHPAVTLVFDSPIRRIFGSELRSRSAYTRVIQS